MKQSSIFIFSLLSLGINAFGQVDSLASKNFALEFAVDYGKILTIPLNFETKIEGAVGIKFQTKYEVLTEIGYSELTPQDAIKNGSYQSKGVYYRLGLTYGGEILPRNLLSIGVMYGASNFEDSGTVIIQSTIWDDFDGSFERLNLTATWFEIIMITEKHMSNNLALGAKFRFRHLTNFINEYNPEVIAIPGYGKAFNSNVPAVNLYVKYRLEF